MGIYEHGSYGCPKSSFDKMFVEGSAKSCMPFRCQSAKSQVLFLRNCAAYLQFLHLSKRKIVLFIVLCLSPLRATYVRRVSVEIRYSVTVGMSENMKIYENDVRKPRRRKQTSQIV